MWGRKPRFWNSSHSTTSSQRLLKPRLSTYTNRALSVDLSCRHAASASCKSHAFSDHAKGGQPLVDTLSQSQGPSEPHQQHTPTWVRQKVFLERDAVHHPARNTELLERCIHFGVFIQWKQFFASAVAVCSTNPCHRTAPEKAPKGPIRVLERHGTSTKRVAEEPFGPPPTLSPSSSPPSLHTHHRHLRSHFGSRSTRTVSLVVEPWSTNALAAAQRGVAGSDDSLLGQSTRGSPSRWHWPRRSTTVRRSGGAARRPTGTASWEPKSFDVVGSKGRPDYLMAFLDATQH